MKIGTILKKYNRMTIEINKLWAQGKYVEAGKLRVKRDKMGEPLKKLTSEEIKSLMMRIKGVKK